MRLVRSFVVSRRQDDVFDWVADVRNHTSSNPDLLAVELAGGRPVGPGAIFTTRFRNYGRVEVRIVDYARPWRLHFRTTGKAEVDNELRFVPVDGGTRVETIAEVPLRGLARVFAPLTRPLMQRVFEKRGERLRRALEERLPAVPAA